MKKLLLIICISLSGFGAQSQVSQKLKAAMADFNADEQLKFALSSLYVINAKTGEVVFDQNSRIGMVTASTEKIVTAATAFDILGAGYKYETKFGIINTAAGKSLYIEPSGDPTLASWRWEQTKDVVFLAKLKTAINTTGVKNLESVIINTKNWDDETIPDGWIWQDLGNYYGAAAQVVNWRENQFDLILKSGANPGSPVAIVKTNPFLYDYKIISQATAGPKDAGDNSYLYYPSMGEKNGVLKGSIPAGQNNFTVSGSIYNPANQFVKTIINSLKGTVSFNKNNLIITKNDVKDVQWFYTQNSPDLSKIIYWFLRKSVNIYGEALLKTMAIQKSKKGSTYGGVKVVQDHWQTIGIDAEELHLYDGSGLSPQNRITTHAQVEILKYAKQRAWFKDYYEAFPLYNDMKMKSGTINRVKGFSGYQQAKDGNEYIFSFLVNNYSGSEYSLIRKLYKVLDVLKAS